MVVSVASAQKLPCPGPSVEEIVSIVTEQLVAGASACTKYIVALITMQCCWPGSRDDQRVVAIAAAQFGCGCIDHGQPVFISRSCMVRKSRSNISFSSLPITGGS